MILHLNGACSLPEVLPVLLTSGTCISASCSYEVLDELWYVLAVYRLVSYLFVFLNPSKRHHHFCAIVSLSCQGIDNSTMIWCVACKYGLSIGQHLLVTVLSMLYVSLAVNPPVCALSIKRMQLTADQTAELEKLAYAAKHCKEPIYGMLIPVDA